MSIYVLLFSFDKTPVYYIILVLQSMHTDQYYVLDLVCIKDMAEKLRTQRVIWFSSSEQSVMEKGKAKGDYATAYKLSRSNLDRKEIRRQRKSLEQKQLRIEEVCKRRNLQDLSPLQEGELTLIRENSYAGKTPVKRKGTNTGV